MTVCRQPYVDKRYSSDEEGGTRGVQSDELLKPHFERQLWNEQCMSKFFPYLMASYFRAPNYSRLVSVTCESRLFIKPFKTAFAVNLVCIWNTLMTFLYRQLSTTTLLSPLVYGIPLPAVPLPICVSKRDSCVRWDFQIMIMWG